MLVATLIAANATSPSFEQGNKVQFDAALLNGVMTLLADKGIGVATHKWLDEGRAADIFINCNPDDISAKASIKAVLEEFAEQFDIALQPSANREKSLFLSDMDSTMIGQECIDELADYAGVREEITAITESAMRGELDFAASLRARVAKLAGLEEAVIADCLEQRIAPNPGAKTLLATLKSKNVHCLLVSGGFHHFADTIAAQLGFDGVHANRLAVKDGQLSGELASDLFGAQSKADILAKVAAERNLSLAQSFAAGDGANDLPMLADAGLSIGYHAKPVVNQAVDFAIRHNDLSAILYALGIVRSDWQITS